MITVKIPLYGNIGTLFNLIYISPHRKIYCKQFKTEIMQYKVGGGWGETSAKLTKGYILTASYEANQNGNIFSITGYLLSQCWVCISKWVDVFHVILKKEYMKQFLLLVMILAHLLSHAHLHHPTDTRISSGMCRPVSQERESWTSFVGEGLFFNLIAIIINW